MDLSAQHPNREMRAVITGASGFVGRVLTDHLRACGDEVVALSRATGGPDMTDRAGVHDAITQSGADVIYHLAAQAHVPTSWDDPIGTLRVNVEGTQNVLDAGHALGNPRILVVTSAEVYGSVDATQLPIDEDAPLRPANPYAASKVAADAVALQARLGRDQDIIRLRPFNHIGPGQDPSFVCSGLAHRIARAERDGDDSIEVGTLEVRRDFSDVRDVVKAYRRAAVDGTAGSVYNVCSGVDRSIREIAETLVSMATRPVALRQNPELVRPVDTPIVRGSAARLAHDTDWAPQIPLQTSLADILEDARNRIGSP